MGSKRVTNTFTRDQLDLIDEGVREIVYDEQAWLDTHPGWRTSTDAIDRNTYARHEKRYREALALSQRIKTMLLRVDFDG